MIYTFPFIGALLGWVTNYIAIKMLFHPRKEVRILWFRLQGVFPKRQKAIAEKLGKMVSQELLSVSDIKERIVNKENLDGVKSKVADRLETYLNKELPSLYPFLSLFVGAKTKNKIKNSFANELEAYAPEMIENYLKDIERDIDVESIVKDKVELLSAEKLESLIHSVMKRELQYIEVIGGLLGFIVGTVQMILGLYFLT